MLGLWVRVMRAGGTGHWVCGCGGVGGEGVGDGRDICMGAIDEDGAEGYGHVRVVRASMEKCLMVIRCG